MSFCTLPSDGGFSKKPKDDDSQQPASQSDAIKPLKGRRFSVQFQMEKTVQNAAAIAANLNLLKERLLVEFGQSSHSFIAKAIDPMVLHAQKIVEDLQGRKESQQDIHEDTTALKKAIDSVRLYNQFNDEKKLRKKIVHETVETVHHAIDKDCEILKNYEVYFLQNEILLTHERDRVEGLLGNKLAPIFHEFDKLRQQDYQDDDLRKLFMWKSHIDMQRGALTELGLFTVDSLLHHSTQIPPDSEELSVVSQQQVAIDEIADKAQTLMRLTESGTHFDDLVFKEIDHLLSDLKGEVQTIGPSITEEFQEAFASVQDTICQLDIMLQKKRK